MDSFAHPFSRRMGVLIVCAAIACGGDDGGDDGSDAPDTADDETPASDDFAPQDSGDEVDDDGGSTAGDSTSTGGAGGCVEAGQACTPSDYCNTWICTCNAGATEFMTIGSCENGTCTSDGNAACEGICLQSGGVASSFDAGCG